MKTMNAIHLAISLAVLAGLGQLASTAGAASTTGKGNISSAAGDLPAQVKVETTYDLPLTVKIPGVSGWPCKVKATLKSKNWANVWPWTSTTVLTVSGNTCVGSQISFNPSIRVKTPPSAVVNSGELWWEIEVTAESPTIKKIKDSYATTHVKFTVVKK